MNKLYIAFLWHFHQPIYKDYSTNKYLLPWVRLHLIKNYYFMAYLLSVNNKIKATFNFTPSLLEQINDFTEHNASDYFVELSNKNPTELSQEDKLFILNNFFNLNQERIINQNSHYLYLQKKKESLKEHSGDLTESFSKQEYLDLQVLFNLYWLPPNYLVDDPQLSKLLRKKSKFTDQDKETILNKQKEIIKITLPLYQTLLKNNQIEITTSPFYHPIMPLMIDTNLAKKCQDTPLPEMPFRAQEDLEEQLTTGKKYSEECFNSSISGLWPSEGAVSPEIVPIILKAGFNWIASDEAILYKSKKIEHRNDLYRPYFVENEGKRLHIFFRDRIISDLIGFTYSAIDSLTAVKDFIKRANSIRQDANEDLILSIILDGENAWDAYENSGFSFLSNLYQSLINQEGFELCTFSEGLNKVESQKLKGLASGSWVGGDFRLWIGKNEDNTSYDYLRQVRNDYLKFSNTEKEKAKKSLFAAEGSDWNWWYGDEENRDALRNFDYIYRTHLMNVYILNDREIPDFLRRPIIEEDFPPYDLEPRGMINPIINGVISDYFEWYNASFFKPEIGRDVIALSNNLIEKLYFGFDNHNLYFLLKPSKNCEHISEYIIELNLKGSRELLSLTCKKTANDVLIGSAKNILLTSQYDKVLEIGFSFKDAGFTMGESLLMHLNILIEGRLVSRIPKTGYLSFTLPDEHYSQRNWGV
ncbi:MAG: hypothetical protein DDT22_00537 [candidate division WS2 bacterium]|nr:hypothetical protein [Candidatus Lithacetigena glycinireducens]